METAGRTAKIIKQKIQVDAVMITDQEHILAHVGSGDDCHRLGNQIATGITGRVLERGELSVARTRDEIACSDPLCRFTASIVVPLKREETVLGALHLFWRRHLINAVDLELARGLAHLFSTQLALARLDEQARLLAKAEIKALQAQINPHFLFNCLNTIVSMYREKPETARRPLIHLGDFFRQNLQSSRRELVPLERELNHIHSYLVIEKARYQEDLQVKFQIDPEVLDYLLPPLTLQPLVENAVKHGLRPRVGEGTVTVKARRVAGGMEVAVEDNGVGMPLEKIESCLSEGAVNALHRNGIGFANVHRRLTGIFGASSGLNISSEPGRGTAVTFFVPASTGYAEEVRHTEKHEGPGGGRRKVVPG